MPDGELFRLASEKRLKVTCLRKLRGCSPIRGQKLDKEFHRTMAQSRDIELFP